jgi:hypothetical protein
MKVRNFFILFAVILGFVACSNEDTNPTQPAAIEGQARVGDAAPNQSSQSDTASSPSVPENTEEADTSQQVQIIDPALVGRWRYDVETIELSQDGSGTVTRKNYEGVTFTSNFTWSAENGRFTVNMIDYAEATEFGLREDDGVSNLSITTGSRFMSFVNPAASANSLHGQWFERDMHTGALSNSQYIEFLEDGTGLSSFFGEDFTWSVNGDVLTRNFAINDDFYFEYRIMGSRVGLEYTTDYSLTDSTLELMADYGGSFEFTKLGS